MHEGEWPIEIMRLLQKQMAQISAQMLRVASTSGGAFDFEHFPRIIARSPGKLRNDLYQTSNDFYRKLCCEMEAKYADDEELAGDVLQQEDVMRDVRKYSRLLPESFKLLHTSLAPNELFYLVNDDLGFHKILINNDWKIIAVIDLDCGSLAPLSWALKPPVISMMEVKPGSMISSHPIQRMEDIRCNESYRLWLLELQSTLKRQGNLTQLKQIKRFIFLGGRELVLSITAFQDFDLAAGSV